MWVQRHFWRLVIFILISLIAFVGISVYYLISASRPIYEGRFIAPGIQGETVIIRDRYAVPHILARSHEDALFALGFAHAQQRLAQMEISRRAARGRLAELFGPALLERDIFFRSLNIFSRSKKSYRQLDAKTRRLLDAYSDGVNRWLQIVSEGGHGRGAPEFLVYDSPIIRWEPADSIAIGKLMALRLSSGIREEIFLGELLNRLGQRAVDDLFPPYPDLPIPPQDAGASNAWAVAGVHTAGGGSLLASDPHLGISAPGTWMLARMDFGEGKSVIGGTIPGMPGVIIGRNRHIGWGMTSAYVDDQDIFIEKIDAEAGRYWTENGWQKLEISEQKIPIRGEAPRSVTIFASRNGPILPKDFLSKSRSNTNYNYMYSLAWTGLSEKDTTMRALIDLNRADSIEEALAATRYHIAPSQNLVLADARDVAMATIGQAPVRSAEHDTKGRAPSAGGLARNRWQGAIPWEQMPRYLRPKEGIVANANNPLRIGEYPEHLSFKWGAPYRIHRLNQLLAGRRFHSLASFRAIQSDVISPAARSLLPLIAQRIWRKNHQPANDKKTQRRQQALAMLAEWSGAMTVFDPEPLIFTEWMRTLLDMIVQDELKDLADEYRWPRPLFLERVFTDIDGASRWCDVITSELVEDCHQIALSALDQTLTILEEKYGSRMQLWRWGAEHVAIHENALYKNIPFIGHLFAVEHEMAGSDFTLKRATTFGGALGNTVASASGYRMIVDFASPDSSVYITAIGQSGHPLSEHFADLASYWINDDYIPMSMDMDDVMAGHLGKIILDPAAAGEANLQE